MVMKNGHRGWSCFACIARRHRYHRAKNQERSKCNHCSYSYAMHSPPNVNPSPKAKSYSNAMSSPYHITALSMP